MKQRNIEKKFMYLLRNQQHMHNTFFQRKTKQVVS
jgi:hypothetical protein